MRMGLRQLEPLLKKGICHLDPFPPIIWLAQIKHSLKEGGLDTVHGHKVLVEARFRRSQP